MTFTLEESHLWIAGIVAGSIFTFWSWLAVSRSLHFEVVGKGQGDVGQVFMSLMVGALCTPIVIVGYVPWKFFGRYIVRYVRGGE